MCEEKERGLISSVGWERCRFEDIDTRNDAFMDTEKGLGLDSCSNKSFMAMADRHFHGNTSNQEPCRGDIYDVVGAAAAPVNARIPFTTAQWQELERQAMIFKHIMASVPVPAELLIPITGNSSKIAIKGCLELGFSSNSSDPEPWRCRRTDGKKWRCSRDVAPDQKYCERHSHKSRPRSRKLVELPNHSSNISNNARLFTSSFDQSRCLEWFVKGETTVPFASNSSTEWQQFKAQGTDYGLNFQAQNLNEQFSPGLGTESGKDLRPSAPLMADTISWMGSSPGGPLAEALCLGIALKPQVQAAAARADENFQHG